MADVSISGRASTSGGTSGIWHFLSSSGNYTTDGLQASGSLSVVAVNSNTVHVRGSATNTLIDASRSSCIWFFI